MLRVEHDCEIVACQQDILFLPGRSRLGKIFDWCRRAMMASNRNPAAPLHLRSQTMILWEKRRHFRNYRRIIHPFSMFRYWWTFIMIVILTILLFIVPYQAAFDMTRTLPGWTFLKNALLLICCTDIFINCTTGYFDERQVLVEMDQVKIMKRYMRHGSFFTDLLASLPTDLLFAFSWRDMTVAREVTSLVHGFRVFSLSTYIAGTARIHGYSLAVYEFLVILFWLALILHWQACLYWILPIAMTSTGYPRRPKDDAWMHETGLWEVDSRVEQYFTCVMRAITTFLRSGFLRMYPKNDEDVYIVIFLQITSALAIWIFIARVVGFYKGVSSSKLRYEATLAQLQQYMRHKQLPRPTQKRIVTYYEFRYQSRYFRDAEILNTLSAQMRHEISMHSCRKLVENVTFFNNLPISLLGRIVALLKSEIFLTNDVIVRADQPGDCMYFIASGTVAIYTSSGKEVCHLEDGAYFGEIALMMPDQWRVASVVAIEVCELYRLDRSDFARTIHPYPMLWDRIKKIAIERHEKTTILSQQ